MRDLLDIPFGIRYVGYWEQQPVSTRSDIIRTIDEHLGEDNIGLSVCVYKGGMPHLLFLPFDFDSDDLKLALDESKRLVNYLLEQDLSFYFSFSGRKGFHVYIETEPKIYTRKQVRYVQNLYKTLLGLSTLDEQIIGDIRRLMRIPGTFNTRGGLCRLLFYHEGKELDLDDIVDDYKFETPMTSQNYKQEFHEYPCVEEWIRNDPEPRQQIRFTYVVLRLSQGMTEDEIIEEMKTFGWVDFNEDFCRKQIRHIAGRDYVPHSCNTLRELGFCLPGCKVNEVDEDLDELGIGNINKIRKDKNDS